MFRKIQSIFHPNSHRRSMADDIPCYDGTGSAVRLIRSTSVYTLGGEQQRLNESLKKCKSTTSIESCAYFQQKEEDRAWMYSKTQHCLQYLQDLLALRKKYLDSINDIKSVNMTSEISPESTKSSKTGKKPLHPLPTRHSSKFYIILNVLISYISVQQISMEKRVPQSNPDVREAIAFLDSVIADLDAERWQKVPVTDLPNADVDFDVATSTRQHSLHSNWILRAPQSRSQDALQIAEAASQSKRNSQRRTTGSRKRLERYPIYLPKAVEGAFSTLKFKPKSCTKD
ncbi:uncharacterized protein C13orf42 homolog [Gopherus flavomarginatus]|uniref:uncharacterized protein C13orf42 homolog n=1 Tax=Gopherus flavomarginatus TaxID=286002 RepID=UPI0021CC3EF9|nr:uncharacterized protein C13orf42 homolog [Gopherus flavomarginatus]